MSNCHPDCGDIIKEQDGFHAHQNDDGICWHDDDDYELVSCCPACGSPIDYCQGHGEIGDPEGFRILELHDNDNHLECHPDGCEEATE